MWRELNSIFKKQDNHILINYIMDMQYKEILELQVATIRKRVCDIARKKIVEATCYDTEEEVRNVIYDLNAKRALEILDEVEKGE